jgi:hypothetical protein
MLETIIAGAILLAGFTGVMNLFIVSIVQNKAQGEDSSLATSLSQAKMEQLLGLSFTDTTALGGSMAANTTKGSVYPNPVQAGYVIYLDHSGNAVAAANAYFQQQWLIQTGSDANLKTITVSTQSLAAALKGKPPYSVLIAMMAKPNLT